MKRIQYKHDFFESSLTATVKYLSMLFQPFSNTINHQMVVGFANMGDEKYLMDMILNEKQYDFTPRCSLDVGGITIQDSDKTNKNTYGSFTALNLDNGRKEDYKAKFQRMPIDISINAELVFTNIIEYFKFLEIYLMITDEYHSIRYYHADRVYEAILEIPRFDDSETNTTFGMNGEKHERKMTLTFNLKTQFSAFRIYGVAGTNFVGNNDWKTSSTNPNGKKKPNGADDDQHTSGEAGNGNDGQIIEPMEMIIHNTEVIPKNGGGSIDHLQQIIKR